MAENKKPGMVVASFVLGLCSIFFFWTFVVPALAVILGIIGLNDLNKNNKTKGKTFAIWGIVLGSFFFITAIIAVSSGGMDDGSEGDSQLNVPNQDSTQTGEETTDSQGESESSDNQEDEEENNIVGIGEEIEVEYMSFKINDVDKADFVGNSITEEQADGVFYIVDMTIENKAKESKDISLESFKLVDGEGRTFDYDSDAEIYYNEKETLSFMTQLQPGLPKNGVKIFDLPEDSENLKLKIECCGFNTETGYINLEQ